MLLLSLLKKRETDVTPDRARAIRIGYRSVPLFVVTCSVGDGVFGEVRQGRQHLAYGTVLAAESLFKRPPAELVSHVGVGPGTQQLLADVLVPVERRPMQRAIASLVRGRAISP